MLTDATDNGPYDECSYNDGAGCVGANSSRPTSYHYRCESGGHIESCGFQWKSRLVVERRSDRWYRYWMPIRRGRASGIWTVVVVLRPSSERAQRRLSRLAIRHLAGQPSAEQGLSDESDAGLVIAALGEIALSGSYEPCSSPYLYRQSHETGCRALSKREPAQHRVTPGRSGLLTASFTGKLR